MSSKAAPLIALRPPEQLASALGLAPFGRDLADRYIALNKLCALNDGINLPPMQFHGRAELYTWHGNPQTCWHTLPHILTT